MKKIALSALAVAMLGATSALAADMKAVLKAPPAAAASPWDIAFGGALMSDYNFRGISQSQKGSSVTAYVETRYNVNSSLQLYTGSQYWSVDLPTNPSCECDFFAGIRPTLGPLAFDFGFMYYYYAKEVGYSNDPTAKFPPFPNGNTTYNNTDYWEVYGKVGYDVIKDRFSVGGNVYYSPDWLKTGADATYASVTAKVTLPSFRVGFGLINEVGWSLSGEAGYYWIGTSNVDQWVWTTPTNFPDYATWNLGVAFTFAKVFTLDVRYYDTDLSKEECNILTADPRAVSGPNGNRSGLCGSSVVVALKADLTYMGNLK